MSATTTTVDLKRADFERFVKLRFPDLSLGGFFGDFEDLVQVGGAEELLQRLDERRHDADFRWISIQRKN